VLVGLGEKIGWNKASMLVAATRTNRFNDSISWQAGMIHNWEQKREYNQVVKNIH
jgi:hypothetical protein